MMTIIILCLKFRIQQKLESQRGQLRVVQLMAAKTGLQDHILLPISHDKHRIHQYRVFRLSIRS